MLKFRENINLSGFCNYKIGGPAQFFFEAKTAEDVQLAAEEAKKRDLRVFVLGGGTNLLISNSGFTGLVLKPAIDFIEQDREVVRAGAGTSITKLLNYLIANELSGLEWAGGLPGTVGGAVYGNAGAFGGETKDSIVGVESFNTETGKIIKKSNKGSFFSYRSSVFKESGGKEIILSAFFKLKPGKKEDIKLAIKEKVSYRMAKHPLEYPNIGSIFKNIPVRAINAEIKKVGKNSVRVSPSVSLNQHLSAFVAPIKNDPFPVIPTAYLISEAGLKGKKIGGATVSSKHPNFIINISSATSKDVGELIALIKKEIKEKFGIDLEEEVRRVGEF